MNDNENMNLPDDEAADIYTLIDEDGVEQDFEMIDEYEENGTIYVAFVPHYENPEAALGEDEGIVVLKAETDEDGSDIFSTVDDDEEYDRIGGIFLSRIEEAWGSDD